MTTVVNIQGAGSPQKKVERIKTARMQPACCAQTFSHEGIQPFKLSRNTFQCKVSNLIDLKFIYLFIYLKLQK